MSVSLRAARLRRAVTSPTVQLLAATAGMAAGAYLVALWMVGVVVMVGCGLLAVDALLRDAGPGRNRRDLPTHDDVLERYRRAR